MNKRLLLKHLNQFIVIKKNAIVEASINVNGVKILQIRDCLMNIGTILEEDFDNNIYVVDIPAGLGNMNHAVVAIQLNKNSIDLIGYAKEGLINQHTAEKAIDKICKQCSNM